MAADFSFSQGSGGIIDAVLRDGTGTVVTTYAGTEALSCTVWAGGNRAVAFSPTATWTDAAHGKVAIVITDAQTTGIDPGRYELMLRVDNGGGQWADAFACTISITRFAGTDTATGVYTKYETLFRYARSWLGQVQTDSDEAGFWEQQETARLWFESILHSKFRVGGPMLASYATSFGPGVRITGARSTTLQSWLDAGYLMINDDIREAVAKKALSIICEGMIGTDTMNSYGKLARMYSSQAEALVSGMTVSLDTDADGTPDITISCGVCVPLFG